MRHSGKDRGNVVDQQISLFQYEVREVPLGVACEGRVAEEMPLGSRFPRRLRSLLQTLFVDLSN